MVPPDQLWAPVAGKCCKPVHSHSHSFGSEPTQDQFIDSIEMRAMQSLEVYDWGESRVRTAYVRYRMDGRAHGL
jgi:hypothetical protein